MAKSSDTSLTAASPPKRFDNATVRIAISAMIALRLWKHARNQSLQPARERQHDRDDDQSLDQLPVFGQPLQRLLQSHHDDGADERSGDAALAAEHDHHQRNCRLMPAEHFGRDEA